MTSQVRTMIPAMPPEPLPKRQFASDNFAGITPEAWASLESANRGHAPAYGEDAWTAAVSDRVRELFEIDCAVFFTFNGTAANSLALATLCRSYHSLICHRHAHLETDECGAPEFFSNGGKVLLVDGADGKLEPAGIVETATRRSDVHYPKPRAVSVTQVTELGTVYRPADLEAIGETCRTHGLRLHMDGARFAQAVAALDVDPKTITWQAGVDVLCLGGTKLGMPVGEMVVFFDRTLADEFEYRCKQAGQLAAKMRFLAAPWLGMLEGDVWLTHARHANARAAALADRLRKIPEVTFLSPTEANSVFVEVPSAVRDGLRERGWSFYTFIGEGGVRLMCSWDTTDEDVDALADDIADLAARTA